MARIAVLSDIHGNLQALECAVREILAWRPDHLWFLGDLVLFGPEPRECVSLLRSKLVPEICIEGNTDRHLREGAWANPKTPDALRFALAFARDALSADDHDFLRGFARDVTIEAGGVSFHLCHGAPGNDEARLGPGEHADAIAERLRAARAPIVLAGHTHIPWRTRAGEVEVLNDGSVGFPFDGDKRGAWLALEAAGGTLGAVEFRRFEFDNERTIALLTEYAGPMAEILIQRLRTARP